MFFMCWQDRESMLRQSLNVTNISARLRDFLYTFYHKYDRNNDGMKEDGKIDVDSFFFSKKKKQTKKNKQTNRQT